MPDWRGNIDPVTPPGAPDSLDDLRHDFGHHQPLEIARPKGLVQKQARLYGAETEADEGSALSGQQLP